MEEQLSSLAVTHLLQHTLRSLCIHENSQWVYAVFWRILPRNYPPPKWDCQGGAYDRSRGNRRNWILVWEDGFCNFAASSSSSAAAAAADHQINNINGGDHECPSSSASHVYIGNSCDYNNNNHQLGGLQPELFFKMSHEIYNYGEGLIGKVAADHSHKWIYKEPNNQEINFLSAWHNSADSHPRTWEAQFQSGIKTIALIAVREGVIQLGSVQKVIEDLSYVVLLRKKFSYIESIPGVLLPHPSSSSTSAAYHPFIKIDGGYPIGFGGGGGGGGEGWHHFHHGSNLLPPQPVPPPPLPEYYDHHHNYHHHQQVPMKITPSMSSLEALLSKLPSVVVPTSSTSPAPPVAAAAYQEAQQHHPPYVMMGMDPKVVAKEEFDQEDQDQENDHDQKKNGDDDDDQDHDHQTINSRVSSYNHHHHHHPHPHFVSQESMHSHGY